MFKRKKKKEDLPENMEDVVLEIKRLKEENKKIKEEIKKIKEEKPLFLKNIRIKRFNPFSEEGGNQSFSLAVLSEEGDGVVITSLYTRDGSRVYGKAIEGGKSKYSLSKEETEVIEDALKGENKKI